PQLSIGQIFVDLRARLVRADLPEPAESGERGAHDWPFARNAAPPATHRDPQQEIERLLQEKAAAEEREQTLRAEIERLRAQEFSAETAQEKHQLQSAIDNAERMLDDVASTEAAASGGNPAPSFTPKAGSPRPTYG